MHRAELADGQMVAVKVQFLGLEAAVAADMATLASLASAASALFPRAFNFQFLAWTVHSSLADLPCCHSHQLRHTWSISVASG